jgi:hypothetical protein
MSKAQLIKSIVKRGGAEKPSFGTNPWDPWSTKANIAEDAALNTYLKSRGINPEFATKDQKVAHSKTGQFIKWKRDHMLESITEAIDKMDVVMFDIPLLIRMLEYAREDAKTDMDLHKVVEKLIHIRKKGVLTMKDYNFVTRLREDLELDENHVAIAMGQMMDDEGSMVLNQLDQMERAVRMVRDYIGTDYEKQLPAWVQSKLTLASDYIDTVGNYLNSKNEDINEAASASIRMYKALQQAKEKREREERLGNELLNKKPPEQKPVQKEEHVNELSQERYKNYLSTSKSEVDANKQGNQNSRYRYGKSAGKMQDRELNTKKAQAFAKKKTGFGEEVEQIDEIDISSTLASFNKNRPAHAQAKIDTRTSAQRKADTDKMLADRAAAKPKVTHKPVKPSTPEQQIKNQNDSMAKSYASHKRGQYVGDSVVHPEDTNIISEIKGVTEVAPPGFEGTVKAMKKYKKIDNPWALAWSMKNKGYKSHKKADGTQKNENYQDPMAATSMPNGGANSPDDVTPKDKGKKLIQMSKSARIIKSIYKRKGMKEEIYDHEKEDKSVATYGKKPKIQTTGDSTMEKPQAAAIMTGGTTLTGEKRDTIEIDPMMKMRSRPDSGKR